MDGRVDQRKDPDRGRHVADTGPHAHHRAGVVVGLQGGALLALGQDDGGVDDLVELGQVEDPAEVGQALVPETTHVGGVRQAVGQLERGVRDRPGLGGGIEGGRVAISARAIDLAQGVHNSGEAITLGAIRPRIAKGLEHADKGPGRVDSKEDIVQDHKGLEEARVTEGIRLVPATLVDAVDQDHGEGVDGGDGDGHAHIQHLIIESVRNIERLLPCRMGDVWRGNGVWTVGRWEVEERGRWESDSHCGGAKLRGHIDVVHGECECPRFPPGIELDTRGRRIIGIIIIEKQKEPPKQESSKKELHR